MLWSTSGDLFASFTDARSTTFSAPEINTILDSILSLKRAPFRPPGFHFRTQEGVWRPSFASLHHRRVPRLIFKFILSSCWSRFRVQYVFYDTELRSHREAPVKRTGYSMPNFEKIDSTLRYEHNVAFKNTTSNTHTIACRKLAQSDGVDCVPSRPFRSFNKYTFAPSRTRHF